jgi:hypothetical protein
MTHANENPKRNDELMETSGLGSAPEEDGFVLMPDSFFDEKVEDEEVEISGLGSAPEEDGFIVMPDSFFEEDEDKDDEE